MERARALGLGLGTDRSQDPGVALHSVVFHAYIQRPAIVVIVTYGHRTDFVQVG